MNTPTIAAALSSPSAQTGRAAGNSGDAESGSSFSHVLGDQHAAIEQQSRTATHAAAGKASKSAKAGPETDSIPSGAELAELAGEQGLSLPQIALSLAAHALGGTTQRPATPSEDLAATMTTHVQDLPRGKTEPVTLLALAQARDDTLTKAGAQADDVSTAMPARFSITPTDDQPQSALNSPAVTGLTAPNLRAATILTRTSAAAVQPASKTADPAESISSLIQNTSATTAPSTTAIALPDNTNAAGLDVANVHDIAALAASGSHAQNAGSTLITGNSPGVSAPLLSPQWPSEFGRQFVMLSQNAGNQPQTAELRLDPPELGPLRITININDNVAHAVFVSAHASVRNAIENALPQLQQQLAQAGISLGQANVNDQGHHQSAFEQSSQFAGKPVGSKSGGATTTGVESVVAHAGARAAQHPNSLVDTFA